MHIESTDRWSNDLVALRLLRAQDVTDDYIAWLNDPEINRYLESRFTIQNRAGVEAFVNKMLDDDRVLFLAIHDLGLGRHVGNIKLGPVDRPHRLGEIGLMIGDRAAWNRGIGTAAIRLVMAIAKHELGLRRLTAGCYASNVGSAKAFEKAGFRVEAVRPAHFLLDGRPEDLILLGAFIV